MSKQEETSGEGAPMAVEQKESSQHKLYRPTDMQQEASSELYNRSIAPIVPLPSSERQSHHVKKSSSKRRDSSPENIAMALIDIQKDDGIATISQPIPSAATAISESKVADKMHTEKKADEDSIVEDIAELRNAEEVSPEWIEQPTHSSAVRKKEISWEDTEYLENVPLPNEGAKSQATLLERTASVGPCFKPKMLYGGPSGIFVCVPKKSVRSMKEDSNPIQSVINFNISKKYESNSAPHMEARYQKGIPKKADGQKQKPPKKLEKELKIEAHPKFIEVLRGKLDNMTWKIRNLLNI